MVGWVFAGWSIRSDIEDLNVPGDVDIFNELGRSPFDQEIVLYQIVQNPYSMTTYFLLTCQLLTSTTMRRKRANYPALI